MSENTVGTETKKVTGWGRKAPMSKKKIAVISLVFIFLGIAGYVGIRAYQDSKKPVVKEYKFTEEELQNIVKNLKTDPNTVKTNESRIPKKTIEQYSEENRNSKGATQ